jgi:bifunctional non-homologous end joining protein LigD
MPGFINPMAARLVETLPTGEEWLYEVKLDGYRALLLKDGARVSILSPNEKDLTRMYSPVVAAGKRLNAKQVMLDGEIVALDEKGASQAFKLYSIRHLRPGSSTTPSISCTWTERL